MVLNDSCAATITLKPLLIAASNFSGLVGVIGFGGFGGLLDLAGINFSYVF